MKNYKHLYNINSFIVFMLDDFTLIIIIISIFIVFFSILFIPLLIRRSSVYKYIRLKGAESDAEIMSMENLGRYQQRVGFNRYKISIRVSPSYGESIDMNFQLCENINDMVNFPKASEKIKVKYIPAKPYFALLYVNSKEYQPYIGLLIFNDLYKGIR
jgi:hypothetical protein